MSYLETQLDDEQELEHDDSNLCDYCHTANGIYVEDNKQGGLQVTRCVECCSHFDKDDNGDCLDCGESK